MIGKVFWMGVGAGVGLWGRKRAIDEYDKRVPKPVQKVIKRDVVDRVKRFADEVGEAQRRQALEQELEELRERDRRRRSGEPEN